MQEARTICAAGSKAGSKANGDQYGDQFALKIHLSAASNPLTCAFLGGATETLFETSPVICCEQAERGF